MIRKEVDENVGADKFSQAGLAAEKQMAFYLRRAFGDDHKISVLHDMRLEQNGDAAQIDHLIVHPYGMIIVESKSVVGSVTINPHGEWSRQFGGVTRGMHSPIRQAEMQAAFLQKFLNAFGPPIPTLLVFQRTYDKIPIDVLVAISDSGIIRRQGYSDPPNVCKADSIPEKIRRKVQSYSEGNSILGLSIKPPTLNDATIQSICARLIELNKPTGLERIDVPAPAPISYHPSLDKKGHQPIPQAADSVASGFCIQCRKTIELAPKVPFCKDCYVRRKTSSKTVHGRYCHICGEINDSTLNKPCCIACYEAYKDKLEFFVAHPRRRS
ncbi:MAG: nuclease-related domain-containing protein [Dehalococcoidales bacterium]|nr:nuclease-related domain-containing protein [Dehalococcoidales bacterium]